MHLYKINLDYIKYLYYNYDNKVQYNEAKGVDYNNNRPYVGIIINVNCFQYFAPLEHPRPQHKNLKNNPHIIKINNGKYGIIGLNNMIPVHKQLLIDFDINTESKKDILQTQLIFCQKHKKEIQEKSKIVYKKRTTSPNSFEEKIYCDFAKLEKGLIEYLKKKGISFETTLNVSNTKAERSIFDKLEENRKNKR